MRRNYGTDVSPLTALSNTGQPPGSDVRVTGGGASLSRCAWSLVQLQARRGYTAVHGAIRVDPGASLRGAAARARRLAGLGTRPPTPPVRPDLRFVCFRHGFRDTESRSRLASSLSYYAVQSGCGAQPARLAACMSLDPSKRLIRGRSGREAASFRERSPPGRFTGTDVPPQT